jgi:hypothetical protein
MDAWTGVALRAWAHRKQRRVRHVGKEVLQRPRHDAAPGALVAALQGVRLAGPRLPVSDDGAVELEAPGRKRARGRPHPPTHKLHSMATFRKAHAPVRVIPGQAPATHAHDAYPIQDTLDHGLSNAVVHLLLVRLGWKHVRKAERVGGALCTPQHSNKLCSLGNAPNWLAGAISKRILQHIMGMMKSARAVGSALGAEGHRQLPQCGKSVGNQSPCPPYPVVHDCLPVLSQNKARGLTHCPLRVVLGSAATGAGEGGRAWRGNATQPFW